MVTRALVHLQRSIVADDTIRQRWWNAFSDRETACEALGACHLLAHGIWAFKTSAEGERTDLVLGQSLAITDDVRSASHELPRKAQEAFEQANRYREGILAGFEVASPRYLIIVSADHLAMPSVREEAGVKYEYRNIAVAPTTPSQHATANSKGPKTT